MTWFFIALIGPILYAVANHTDKYLISKYLKGGGAGALIIFSAIFSVVVLPISLIINPGILDISIEQAILLIINGILVVLAILCYFYALNKDEATYVVPFYQTIPIFTFILGYFVLGETITALQAVASLIIIFGAFILSFDINTEKIRFKKEVVLLMLTASLLYAVSSVVFKFVAINNGFWQSIFWEFAGKVIVGIFFFLFISKYRAEFLNMLKTNKGTILGLNSLSESTFIVAESAMQYASLIAPVVLVSLVNSFQPVFVFALGIILTLFFPKISKESVNKKALAQKIVGIGLVIVGTCFIGV